MVCGSGFGHFANDSSLTEAQIAIFSAWAEAGAPAGDEHDAPPPRKWAEGWNIPPPDRVVTMPKAVRIPARGEVEYTYEIVPTHFAEDRWVQMSELRPGSAGACASCGGYLRPPDSQWLRHAPLGEPFTASTLTDPEERRQAHETTSDLLIVYARREFAGRVEAGHGQVYASRVRSGFSDALHDQWIGGSG